MLKEFLIIYSHILGGRGGVDFGISLGRRESGTRRRPWMFGRARLSSAPSNPHVKLFPAVHRKLPAEGPTVTASAWDSWECGGGSIRKRGGGGLRESVSVLVRRGWEQQLDSCGSHSLHVNMFAPSCFHDPMDHLMQLRFWEKLPSVKCVRDKRHGEKQHI